MATWVTEIVRAMCWRDLIIGPKWSWVMYGSLEYCHKENQNWPHHHHEESLVALVVEHQHEDNDQQLKIT